MSMVVPSLIHYGRNDIGARTNLRERLLKMSLKQLQKATGLSRHTILRARRGQNVHLRSLHRLGAGLY